jgi:hypothetical protein
MDILSGGKDTISMSAYSIKTRHALVVWTLLKLAKLQLHRIHGWYRRYSPPAMAARGVQMKFLFAKQKAR